MPTPTYIPLATITLSSTDSQIDFANIPATYRDLVLIMSARASSTLRRTVTINFNDSADNDITRVVAFGGYGGGAGSVADTSKAISTIQDSASAYSTQIIQIFDYAQTNKHKPFLIRNNNDIYAIDMFAGRWGKTNAINKISLNSGGDAFAVGSTFSLFGIAG